MEKINRNNTSYQQSSEVLISLREPYNKNCLWIYPIKDEIEIRIFNKGWKVLFSTKDLGLSSLSFEQVNDIINSVKEQVQNKSNKQYTKLNSSLILLQDKQKEFEKKLVEIDNKIDKIIKRINNISSK